MTKNMKYDNKVRKTIKIIYLKIIIYDEVELFIYCVRYIL
jgi:hypothetical protein